jgi:transposase
MSGLSKNEEIRLVIVKLHEAKSPVEEICRKVRKSRHYVERWIQFYEERGSIHDAARSGRPSIVPPKLRRSLVMAAKGIPRMSPRKLAKRFSTDEESLLSRNTITRTLKQEGLRLLKIGRVPQLTEVQKQRRVDFATKLKNEDFHNWWFTDEEKNSTQGGISSQNDRVWDVPGTTHKRGVVKYPPTLSFWAAISTFGKCPLQPYTGNLNAARYIEVVNGALDDLRNISMRVPMTFQQDGATAHTAATTTVFLQKIFFKFTGKGEWPSNSPDLNPLENLWSIMDIEVQKENPQTKAELEKAVLSAWQKIPLDTVKRCIASIPGRLVEVIKTNGEHTLH